MQSFGTNVESVDAVQPRPAHTHVPFASWTGERAVAAIGTNTGSAAIPFQSWRKFKEAFAPELIDRAFSESGSVGSVIDPFGGSGTTALAAQFLGAKPTTIEVNPFLADLIEAKIAQYDFEVLVASYAEVRRKAKGREVDSASFISSSPKTFIEPGLKGKYLFSRRVAARFFAYKQAIDNLGDVASNRLFRVLLAGLSVSVSNAIVSGKGRRYRKNWSDRPTDSNQIDLYFERLVLDAMRDLRRYNARKCREYSMIRGDARQIAPNLEDHDLAVFSPPYPNSFDYTDVYNIELWMGGYLSSSAENRTLREKTLRSHVQIHRSMAYAAPSSPAMAEAIERLDAAKAELWNRNIPSMIGAYFDDMAVVLRGIKGCLRPRGRVYMVVGDSRYANVDVPVARILAEQAPELGFKIVYSEPFRSMRVSPQQGGQTELPETLIVLSTAD